MRIESITSDRERFLDLLLLADPSKEIVSSYIGRGYLFVLFEEEQALGVLHLDPLENNVIEIKNIAIKAGAQGKGWGKQLIAHAIDFCQTKGFEKIIVGTGNSSIGNLAFYQKAGFRFAAIKRNFFVDHYEEEIYENGIQCRDLLILERLLKITGRRSRRP